MLAWLATNRGTILVTVILLAIVSLIIIKLKKDKKQGKSTCGGNCAHCGMACKCHKG